MLAKYGHALDPTAQVPGPDLLPWRCRRAVRYLNSPADIAALLDAGQALSTPLRRATIGTLIRLLSVSGMRIGEAIALDRADVDLRRGRLVIEHGKVRQEPRTRPAREHRRHVAPLPPIA